MIDINDIYTGDIFMLNSGIFSSEDVKLLLGSLNVNRASQQRAYSKFSDEPALREVYKKNLDAIDALISKIKLGSK